MAPFPDTVTARIYLDYTVGDDAHVLLMRAAPGFSELGWLTNRDALYAVMLPVLGTNVQLLSERIGFPGQNFTAPYRTIGLAGTGLVASSGEIQPRQITWQGRDTQGRRVRMSWFGVVEASQTNNWRLEDSEESFVGDVLAIIAAPPAEFVTITGEQAVWLPYASVTYNRRQIRRQRA